MVFIWDYIDSLVLYEEVILKVVFLVYVILSDFWDFEEVVLIMGWKFMFFYVKF